MYSQYLDEVEFVRLKLSLKRLLSAKRETVNEIISDSESGNSNSGYTDENEVENM